MRGTAAGLAERGFRKGDVLAHFAPNLPEYAVAFHSVATVGGVNTTANPFLTADESISSGTVTSRRARRSFSCNLSPIVLALAKHPLVDRFDLSSVELISCSALILCGDCVGVTEDEPPLAELAPVDVGDAQRPRIGITVDLTGHTLEHDEHR